MEHILLGYKWSTINIILHETPSKPYQIDNKNLFIVQNLDK